MSAFLEDDIEQRAYEEDQKLGHQLGQKLLRSIQTSTACMASCSSFYSDNDSLMGRKDQEINGMSMFCSGEISWFGQGRRVSNRSISRMKNVTVKTARRQC